MRDRHDPSLVEAFSIKTITRPAQGAKRRLLSAMLHI
jgi:hypothetical protein